MNIFLKRNLSPTELFSDGGPKSEKLKRPKLKKYFHSYPLNKLFWTENLNN